MTNERKRNFRTPKTATTTENKQLPCFPPELRSLSLSPAGLACQEGETKSISPASLTFLCAGVEAAGGTDRKISKHMCCWRGRAQSEASVTAVREERPPSGEPAITAGCALRHVRLELTLEGK